jgi:hypothetical protein
MLTFRSLALLVPFLSAPFAGDTHDLQTTKQRVSGISALAETQYTAAQLLQAALTREASGDFDGWRDYLTRALERDQDFEPARWHAGYLREGDGWLSIDEKTRVAAEDELLASYRQLRLQSADTVSGHLQLARWCRKHGLKDEERAHLTQVLLKDPANVSANTAIGNRQIRGVWWTEEELRSARDQQERARDSIIRWTSYLDGVRLRLEDKDLDRRNTGRDRLLAVAEPDVIPAMERILSRRSEPLADEVLGVLKTMEHPDASMSLVRHSVFAQWDIIRCAAAKLLSERPFDHFVPVLVSTLRGPIASQYAVSRRPDGRLLYEHVLFREGPEMNERVVLESSFRRRGNGSGLVATERALNMINRAVTNRQHAVTEQNNHTELFNNRVIATLQVATGEELGADPNAWWQWWADRNGVYYMREEKPVHELSYTARYTVPDREECLVAGTPVWTITGPMPIESIQAGDRVLAQDPDSGKLEFKPVLRTTRRRPTALVTITINQESITATEGHPFWVAGTGWIVARSIVRGAVLHGVNGGATVDAAGANADEQPTHNLVVADYHTYFVGNNKILVHDNSVRKPTSARVPGQSQD